MKVCFVCICLLLAIRGRFGMTMLKYARIEIRISPHP